MRSSFLGGNGEKGCSYHVSTNLNERKKENWPFFYSSLFCTVLCIMGVLCTVGKFILMLCLFSVPYVPIVFCIFLVSWLCSHFFSSTRSIVHNGFHCTGYPQMKLISGGLLLATNLIEVWFLCWLSSQETCFAGSRCPVCSHNYYFSFVWYCSNVSPAGAVIGVPFVHIIIISLLFGTVLMFLLLELLYVSRLST